MSTERHSYAYNRVLIDSARVLSPQFDDAVIYVTGAQLELLRNVTQYLNRLTTYASEIQPGYYLTPTIADFDDILEIVADLEETLMGNPNTIWGYTERWSDLTATVSVGAGYTDAVIGPVPAGYVQVLEYWQIYHNDVAARAVIVQLSGGDGEPFLLVAPNQNQDEYVGEYAYLTLSEGDYLRLRVYALATGKACSLVARGYKMIVPEE